MSVSGLYPVQTWLWSVLDDLGIDGVIYSRHILDLLISSKHTVDYKLEKKEQSIFSKITPSAKKRKHKYSRRSSSFSACEEILWKKEIAVACLLSAADTTTNYEDTANSIQKVVDELYTKLAGLHLTSDFKKANSEGDCSAIDHNGNNLDMVDWSIKPKSKKKENYEDAFPSLDGSNSPPVSDNCFDSIWRKTKRTEPKTGRDSDNIQSKPPKPTKDPKSTRFYGNRKNISSSKLQFTGSRSDDENTSAKNPKRNISFSLSPRNRNRMYRKPRAASTGSDDYKIRNDYFYKPRSQVRAKYTSNSQFGSKRNGSGRKTGQKMSSPQKKKMTNSTDACKKANPSRFNNSGTGINQAGGTQEIIRENQLDYAHLPSWMETTFTDISNPYIWTAYETYNFENVDNNQEFTHTEEESNEMPFSSRWYRDPDTGLLTFQPLKSGSASLSSNSASSLSEESEDDITVEVDLNATGVAAPENWMWCPSPSLWEDGQTSPVSRLQSVYKRELMSFGAEDHVNDISGRIWEEYKTIFLDLQAMDAGSDSENSSNSADESSDDLLPPVASSVWSSNSDYQATGSKEFGSIWDDEETSLFETPRKAEQRFDMWNEALTASFGVLMEKSVSRNLRESFDASTNAHQSAGEPVHGIGSASESSLWRYSPMPTWSTEDDMPRPFNINHADKELSVLMENGTFGYPCHAKEPKDEWRVLPKKEPQHTVWGGGDMLGLQKPNSPQKENQEERMMHNLVDALFSDLSFELLFGPKEEEQSLPFSEIGSQKLPEVKRNTPCFDNNFQALSFDFRSLFLQSPIENFRSPENNPWQHRWDIDDLFSEAGMRNMDSFAKLDDLFESLASEQHQDLNQRPLECGTFRGSQNKKTTFLDSVTDNEAWKTSLRIGNFWQSISGVRPVNVIYSENKSGPGPDETLIPSSATHFRPISESLTCEGIESPGLDTALNTEMTQPIVVPSYNDTGQVYTDLGLILPADMNSATNTDFDQPVYPTIPEEPNYSKLVHDKSMQTAFGMTSDIATCQDLLPRPPRANSR